MTNEVSETEILVASVARILAAQGSAREVAILAVSTATLDETEFDSWNGGTYGYTLLLSVSTQLYTQILDDCKTLEDSIAAVGGEFFKARPNEYLHAVKIVPAMEASKDWRAKAQAWVSGKGITNQGRVRSNNIASRTRDGLLFRSEVEINLYVALKEKGVTFAPLPVFIRGGIEYRRIEPDFVIIKDGIMLHVEVDGDTVHQESPVEAHARSTMLLHEGVPIERVKASECENLVLARDCATRLLAVLAKHKSSRS